MQHKFHLFLICLVNIEKLDVKVCLSNTYSIFGIRDSHKSTVMIGCVRVSGEILRRKDVEINEPKLFKIFVKVLNRTGVDFTKVGRTAQIIELLYPFAPYAHAQLFE